MNADKYLEYLRFLPPNAPLEVCRFCARSQHSALQSFEAWDTIDVRGLYIDVINLEVKRIFINITIDLKIGSVYLHPPQIDIVPECPQLVCANCVQNLTDFQAFLHKMREVNAFWKQYYLNVSEEPASENAEQNTEQPKVVNADESIVLDDDDDVAIVEEPEDLLEQPVYVMIRADGSCMGVVQAPCNDQQELDAANDNSTDIIELLDDSDDNEDDTQNSNDCSESSSFRADHKCSFCSQQFVYQYVRKL